MNETGTTLEETGGADGGSPRSRVVMQVAGILITIGVLLKLFRMQNDKADERAFGRLAREVDRLQISSKGRDALRGVIDYAKQLSKEARRDTSRA
jgi:hypothetical protein